MSFELFLLVTPYISFLLLFFALAVYVYRTEKSKRAGFFILTMISLGSNMLSMVGYYLCISHSWIIFFHRLQYSTAMLMTVFWFLFAIYYFNENNFRLNRLSKFLAGAMTIIPLFTLFIIWTNFGNILWDEIWFEDVGLFEKLKVKLGFYYWIEYIYHYLLVISGMILILIKIYSMGKTYMKQAIVITIGVGFPVLWVIFGHYLIISNRALPIKISQFGFAVTAIAFTWGIFRRNFLDIAPIAMRLVFTNMRDIIFVMNTEHRIMDINQATKNSIEKQILPSKYKDLIGRTTTEVFSAIPYLNSFINQNEKGRQEIEISNNGDTHYYNLSIDPILNKEKECVGKVLTMADITHIQKQKQKIENQRDELENQRDLLTYQKKEITDSIDYAAHIQTALIPTKAYLDELIPDYFILHKPRDVVSGDFYWIDRSGEAIIIIGADCTGHGVPGALLSMLGITFLESIVKNEGITNPAELLNRLRLRIIASLHQTGAPDEIRGGMDIAAITLLPKQNEILFAGAKNPLYVVLDNKLIENKGDRFSVSYAPELIPFSEHRIRYENGSMIYIFSDGFPDQFGGPNRKKYKYARFRDLLISISPYEMDNQEDILANEYDNWRGDIPQIDDVLVMGIRL